MKESPRAHKLRNINLATHEHILLYKQIHKSTNPQTHMPIFPVL